MVIFRFDDNHTRVLAEIATLLAVAEADQGDFPQRICYPGDVLYQLLASPLVIDIPFSILRVMEIDVAVDILRVIAVLVIAVMRLVIPVTNHFYTCADKGKCEKCPNDCITRGKQSPYTFGKLAVSLVPE